MCRRLELAAVCAAALLLWPALAGAADTFADLRTLAGTPDVSETACRYDVKIDGAIAFVTTTHTLHNRGADAHEAVYGFALPAEAAVTGVRVTLPGGKTTAGMVVDAAAAIDPLPEDGGEDGEPDVALLRLMHVGERHAVYELRVFPVGAGRDVTVAIDWLAPLAYGGGRLALRVPSRGGAADLATPAVHLLAAAPAGAKGLSEVAASGKVLARGDKVKGPWKLAAPREDDLVIEVTPRFAGAARPVATAARHALADGQALLAVSVFVPPPTPAEIPRYDRVVFVVDVSRSLGEDGRRAARTVVQSVLGALPAETRVEGVLFDRTARRVWNGWGDNVRDGRKKLDAAIAEAAGDNGSDLGAALAAVRPIVKHRTAEEKELAKQADFTPSTLVVVVSDGLAPLALTGDRAVDRYGADLLDDAFVVAVTLFPEGASAPAPDAVPAGVLAIRAGGRSLAVRVTEATEAGARLAAELAQPAPLRALRLDTGAAIVDGLDLPGELAPGQGALVIARSWGALPAKLMLTGRLAGDEIELNVGAAGGGLQRAVLPLWLAAAGADGMVPLAEREADGEYDSPRERDVFAAARRAFQLAAREVGLVSRETSLVAVHPTDAFARDRAAFARKWGPGRFQRVLPAPERWPNLAPESVSIARPSERAAVATPRAFAPTGELDEKIVRRLMQTYLVPAARVCYQKALRADPKAAGAIDLVVEMSRGEVTHAYITSSTFKSAEVDLCVLDAAFAIQVPRVGIGDADEPIVVARYPLAFKLVDRDAQVLEEERAPVVPSDPKKGGAPIPE